MNIPISAGEVTIDPTTLLFDENLIMNKEITELITNTLLLRDTKEQPLQEHELNLMSNFPVWKGKAWGCRVQNCASFYLSPPSHKMLHLVS